VTGRNGARLAIALLLISIPTALTAYLKIGVQVGSSVVVLKWKTLPVRYLVTNRGVANVTAQQFQTATDAAFGAWTSVPTAQLSSQFIGFTGIDPTVDSGQTVLGFESHPEQDTVLGSTHWEFDTSGNPRAAHIFLNTFFAWSVDTPGQPGRFDVQSIMTHEIGHLFGLSHSAIGETNQVSGGRSVVGKGAVMFPIAFPPSNGTPATTGNTIDRTLKPDDIAGISDIYGTTAFQQQFGQVRGKVTMNGTGVFGAHVTAFNQRTGAIIGNFSLENDGSFVIGGLDPGIYLVRAEPLDDADIDSFFDTPNNVNINFKATYHPKLVAVPAGGASTAIEIKVVPK